MVPILTSARTLPRITGYICDACQTRQFRTRVNRRVSRRRESPIVTSFPTLRYPPVNAGATEGTAAVSPRKPSDDPNYKPAETWKDLEHIGSPEWVEQKLDRKPTFKGYGQRLVTPIDPRGLDTTLQRIAKELGLASDSDQSAASWLKAPTTEPRARFQIATLLLRDLGLKVSDASLHSAKTLSDIRTAIVASQRPTKTVQLLSHDPSLTTLPNVNVHSRRVTSIDSHKQVGRWGLIEDELVRRGLPVTGHNEVNESIPLNVTYKAPRS